jgi:hypothetical protein
MVVAMSLCECASKRERVTLFPNLDEPFQPHHHHHERDDAFSSYQRLSFVHILYFHFYTFLNNTMAQNQSRKQELLGWLKGKIEDKLNCDMEHLLDEENRNAGAVDNSTMSLIQPRVDNTDQPNLLEIASQGVKNLLKVVEIMEIVRLKAEIDQAEKTIAEKKEEIKKHNAAMLELFQKIVPSENVRPTSRSNNVTRPAVIPDSAAGSVREPSSSFRLSEQQQHQALRFPAQSSLRYEITNPFLPVPPQQSVVPPMRPPPWEIFNPFLQNRSPPREIFNPFLQNRTQQAAYSSVRGSSSDYGESQSATSQSMRNRNGIPSKPAGSDSAGIGGDFSLLRRQDAQKSQKSCRQRDEESVESSRTFVAENGEHYRKSRPQRENEPSETPRAASTSQDQVTYQRQEPRRSRNLGPRAHKLPDSAFGATSGSEPQDDERVRTPTADPFEGPFNASADGGSYNSDQYSAADGSTNTGCMTVADHENGIGVDTKCRLGIGFQFRALKWKEGEIGFLRKEVGRILCAPVTSHRRVNELYLLLCAMYDGKFHGNKFHDTREKMIVERELDPSDALNARAVGPERLWTLQTRIYYALHHIRLTST